MASQLSPRQREILDLVAEGRTSKEIAAALGISESTVNWHLANAFERLGASSRAEAVALSMRANGSTPAPVSRAPVRPAPARIALPRLVAIAIAIAIAGALLGGATVATLYLWQPPLPTATPVSSSGRPPTPTPASDSESLAPLPAVSAPPLPTVPVTLPTPALPSLPVTPPPLPGPSVPLPTPPIPTPTLPIP
jgi:DNA-binding CsgD family transcriptional regulator